MSGTVYLKIEKNVQIHSRIVSFKDIAQIVADDSALENKIRVLKQTDIWWSARQQVPEQRRCRSPGEISM